MAKRKQKKKAAIEIELWDVLFSYPDLADPKPFKGKRYYSMDVLFNPKHPSAKKLQATIDEVCEEAFGDDRDEWPEKIPFIKKGSERADSKGYEGRTWIKVSTNADNGEIDVVDQEGEDFNPKMVRGGMFGNVAVRVSAWEFDGDEGVSVYLQGVQVNTDKEPLNFGGGKSAKSRFAKKDEEEDSDEEDDTSSKKKSTRSRDEDEEEDEKPARKSKSKPKRNDEDDFDDEDETPAKKSTKKRSRDYDEDEED